MVQRTASGRLLMRSPSQLSSRARFRGLHPSVPPDARFLAAGAAVAFFFLAAGTVFFFLATSAAVAFFLASATAAAAALVLAAAGTGAVAAAFFFLMCGDWTGGECCASGMGNLGVLPSFRVQLMGMELEPESGEPERAALEASQVAGPRRAGMGPGRFSKIDIWISLKSDQFSIKLDR